MKDNDIEPIIQALYKQIELLIPVYMQNEADSRIANGNVAICIIDEAGSVHGKLFGTNKLRLRQSFQVAWTKASQVWLTGVKTGEYERMVFTNEVDEAVAGIETPDLIGWVGGQPLTLADGQKLAVGFSGFRGVIDIEIVLKALAQVTQ
ncbi:MAG TPA: hypothetical protein VM010_04305 [Chitinophagaceae bacterium]|nr:hypothetical protein [Chitinophagaceae bacterium]